MREGAIDFSSNSMPELIEDRLINVVDRACSFSKQSQRVLAISRTLQLCLQGNETNMIFAYALAGGLLDMQAKRFEPTIPLDAPHFHVNAT